MKYFSTFTGVGGLDWGLEELGFECVGFSDIKETSIKIYKSHYPDRENFGDITKIDFKSLPDFDILTGGFPCQAFSIAGARRGFDDRKGQMIFHLYDLLMEKKPQYAVLENVKGLLNHNNGDTFVNVLQLLNTAGYFVRVLLLNSLNYGSAQNRERLIFLCSRTDFEKKIPVIIDQSKRFRDIRDSVGPFKYITLTDKNLKKLAQKNNFENGDFNFELIGGYDRVGALTTQDGCGEKAVWEVDKYRYLTVLECERLQGFPDGWTEGVKDTARYFAMGNAVNCKMSSYLFTNYLKGVWW